MRARFPVRPCCLYPRWLWQNLELFHLFLSFLFVDEFNQALAEVIKVKDLHVQNSDGPLDFSVHAVPFLQRVIQLLFRVLDATLHLGITHFCLLHKTGDKGRVCKHNP